MFTNVPVKRTTCIVSEKLLADYIHPDTVAELNSLTSNSPHRNIYSCKDQVYKLPDGLSTGNSLSPLVAAGGLHGLCGV